MKRIFAMVLAIMMVMSLATTAMADEGYSITIEPNPAIGVEDHIYEAYQIFSGTLDSTGTKLSNVEWGKGVDAEKLLEALNKLPAWEAKIIDKSEEKPAEGETPAVEMTTAQQLADLLVEKSTTNAMFEEFRVEAGKCLTTPVATASKKNDEGNYVLDLNGEEAGAGYYLVKDQDGSQEGVDTYTNYILRVAGNDSLYPKSGTVTVDKEIIDAGTAKVGADYSIGDTVHFSVEGTLPQNYPSFTSFNYQFVDTMSQGLTFENGSVKIYLENQGRKDELENPEGATPYFTVKQDGQTITVDFANLKAIPDRTIDASTIIHMEYDAFLNENAVIGSAGNPNTVKIVFDNNPYTGGQGETPEDTVWAFTWRLNVSKEDDTGNSLADAKFVLYREFKSQKEYVILDVDNKVDGWTTDKTKATVMVSKKDAVMSIIGLEANTYYLEETEAPDGYNLLEEPITVIITATAKGVNANGQFELEAFTVKFGNGAVVDGDKASGIVAGTVVNKSGAVLPETGGMGTTVLYIAGAAMVAFAVVMLVTKKRMSAES